MNRVDHEFEDGKEISNEEFEILSESDEYEVMDLNEVSEIV